MEEIQKLGGNANIPQDVRIKLKPITGNDIFLPPAPPTQISPPSVTNNAGDPDISTTPPPQPPSLPRPIPTHLIEDEDFPPDTVGPPCKPPSTPEPSAYPTMEVSDTSDESDGEAEDQEEQTRYNTDLADSIDVEFLKQGKHYLP